MNICTAENTAKMFQTKSVYIHSVYVGRIHAVLLLFPQVNYKNNSEEKTHRNNIKKYMLHIIA